MTKSQRNYENNKEKIKEYHRNRFHNMNNEQREKLNEYHRAWYSKLDEEKKNMMRKDALDRFYLIKTC